MNEGEEENKWIHVYFSIGAMSVHHSMQKNQDMQEGNVKHVNIYPPWLMSKKLDI